MAAVERYQRSASKLLPYLAGRGLGELAVRRFHLGYVEPDSDAPRRYWGRMAIPYMTPKGPVQIRYRRLVEDDSPKFLGDPGVEVTLYNASTILNAHTRPVFLCEGEPDTWAVETLAGFPAVGIPGAKQWKAHPYWARVFTGLPRLILPADGDTAGHDLAAAVQADLPEVHVVRLPDGDDSNSVLARDPAEFLGRCGLA